MNYWTADNPNEFTVTPRETAGGTSNALTADTTLYTADTTLITADATQTNGSTYTIRYVEEGQDENKTANATATSSGSFMTLVATLDLLEGKPYYFKVFDPTGREVYRGKAFTIDPTDPLKYSMYETYTI